MKQIQALFLIIPLILITSGQAFSEGDGHDHAQHEDEHEAREVHLNKEMQEMIGLNLIEVKRKLFSESIDVVGEVAQETENVIHVTSPQTGVLQKYLVPIGATVNEGDVLCEIKAGSGEVIQVKSTSHGNIWTQYLKVGDHLDNLTSIMTIADPDVLRANFDVYEKDLAKIKIGQQVDIKTLAYGDEIFSGKIVFVSPRIDRDTRTIKIRVDISNEDHRLKFGMFVAGEIINEGDENAMLIPATAIQMLENESIVFVPESDDEFVVKEVRLGRRSGLEVEILSGLRVGERIVDKGSFYLKSEALKGQFDDGHNH